MATINRYRVAAAICVAVFTGVCSTGLATVAHAAGSGERGETRSVDLRPVFDDYRLTIKLQGRRDTCHVFTVVAALEYAVARKYDYSVGLSEEYLNWAANEVTGQSIDGATFMELSQALKKWGVCEESYMPYLPVFNRGYVPSQPALDSAREIHKVNFRWHWIKAPVANTRADQLNDAHIMAIKDVLRSGWPVCAGREHNIVIVGFSDDPQRNGQGTFIVRNSNVRTYRIMTYAQVKATSNAALWIDLPLGQ